MCSNIDVSFEELRIAYMDWLCLSCVGDMQYPCYGNLYGPQLCIGSPLSKNTLRCLFCIEINVYELQN